MAKQHDDVILPGDKAEGGGGNNQGPLWPPSSGDVTPAKPPEKGTSSYKEASNEAKLAVLKRDILGDGIKEGKLKKFVELSEAINGSSGEGSDNLNISHLMSPASPSDIQSIYIDKYFHTLLPMITAGDYTISYSSYSGGTAGKILIFTFSRGGKATSLSVFKAQSISDENPVQVPEDNILSEFLDPNVDEWILDKNNMDFNKHSLAGCINFIMSN